MPPKRNQSKGTNQLSLPFNGNLRTDIKAENNIISFACHFEKKEISIKTQQRKKSTKKLIEYADSLDW